MPPDLELLGREAAIMRFCLQDTGGGRRRAWCRHLAHCLQEALAQPATAQRLDDTFRRARKDIRQEVRWLSCAGAEDGPPDSARLAAILDVIAAELAPPLDPAAIDALRAAGFA